MRPACPNGEDKRDACPTFRPIIGGAIAPMTNTSPDTLASRMARFAAHLKYEDLPPAVVHEVKRRVIDSLGCACGAWNEEPCVIARRVAGTFAVGADKGAALLGMRERVSPDW